jgi:hypothetical protein
VQILREYWDILLGYNIVIFTDHKTLSFSNFTSSRVPRWRLMIEQFGQRIQYIKGSHNNATDALSRVSCSAAFSIEELFSAIQYNPSDDFPASFATISKYQLKDKDLQTSLKRHPEKYEPHIMYKSKSHFPSKFRENDNTRGTSGTHYQILP